MLLLDRPAAAPSSMRVRQKQTPAGSPLAKWLVASRESYADRVSGTTGISQRGLAELAGISQARIVQVEGGDVTTRDLIERLAAALGVDPAPGLMAAGFLPDGYEARPEGEAPEIERIPDLDELYEAGWTEDSDPEFRAEIIRYAEYLKSKGQRLD